MIVYIGRDPSKKKRERRRIVQQASKQGQAGIEQKAATPEATHQSSLRSDAFVHRYRTIGEKTQQLAQG